jgi:hypothetical protein
MIINGKFSQGDREDYLVCKSLVGYVDLKAPVYSELILRQTSIKQVPVFASKSTRVLCR